MTVTGFAGPLARAWPRYRDRLPHLLLPAEAALPIAPALDRGVWDPTGPVLDAATTKDLLARAKADLGTPWPVPLASDHVRFHRQGERDAYEQIVFARQRRLNRAAVAAALTLDDAVLDEVADGVTLLCEQSTWCWPAHDDSWLEHGSVVPTVTQPYLDLGAGEVAGQLAWLDALLAGPLDERWPGLRERIRHEVRRRVLAPFVRRRDWHWLGLDGDVHNWSPWIQGNVLVAALRLAEADARTEIVGLVVEGIDRYVASLPADGAIDEGYAYWWNGACRTLEALDLLAHATGGALDASAVPALRATAGFPHRTHLGHGWYLNLADGPARPPGDQPWRALHRAARWVGDDAALAHAAAHRMQGEPVAHESAGLGRYLRAVTDIEWRDAAPGVSPLPRDVWLASTQVLLARPSAGSPRGLTLAVKGGHNAEHHNHNDVGSVVVALDGVPVVIDAGRPTYTAQTFGPDRYAIWTMQSSWHNVPEIAGMPQGAGRTFAAREVSVSIADERTSIELDLAAAYPLPELRSWRRSATLDRLTGRIHLSDEWRFDAPVRTPSLVRFLLAGDARSENHAGAESVVVTPIQGGRSLRLTWVPWIGAHLEVRRLDDPMLSDVWGGFVTRLSIPVGTASHGVLSVTLEEA